MWRHASKDEENVNASCLRGNRLSANCFKNWVIWKTPGEGSFLQFAYTSLILPGLLQMPWWCVCVEYSSSTPENEKDPVALGTRELLLAKEAAPPWYPALRRVHFMFDKWFGFLPVHCYYYCYYYCPKLIGLIFMVTPMSLLVNVTLYTYVEILLI